MKWFVSGVREGGWGLLGQRSHPSNFLVDSIHEHHPSPPPLRYVTEMFVLWPYKCFMNDVPSSLMARIHVLFFKYLITY